MRAGPAPSKADAWTRRQRRDWGAEIERRRVETGLSRAQLAQACEVTPATVGMWERGEIAPRDYQRALISRALGTHPSVLFAFTQAVA